MSLFDSIWVPSSHICGCYFTIDRQRTYLPQAELTSHTTISPVSFSTRLTQRFHNPDTSTIRQLRYAFPLYDGVAVCGYTISYADKVLRGVVKQKDAAKQAFKAAIDKGETAGLLESLPAGVFGVTLGNVPGNTDIVVQITYTGELKHDASIDGLRFVLPTSIAPRYGAYPGQLMKSNVTLGEMRVTVDIDMGNSAIRKVRSPTHPIGLQMGELSTAPSGAANATTPFSNSQASASLSQGTCELSGDFILQINIDDISKPQAILESHPEFPGQRALMATLVPKFALKSATPEIVFIADQSGSISGSKNKSLVAALQVFIKSLPLGVRFNICAFGSRYDFLWPKSQAYNEENVSKALSFVSGFNASHGGTEMLEPIKATFKNHLQDLPLEVMLLTDGEIWQEEHVFSYVNTQIIDEKVDARVFALGIGQDVSHTLVEGVARAGNGFSQFVTQNEDTDQKVMRMLRAALYPHTNDYQLEVNYAHQDTDQDDEDFEIVEKVSELLTLNDLPDSTENIEEKAKPGSFFDTSADLDTPMHNKSETDRFAHLPAIEAPRVLQAPATIPPLFPFNRTSVYLLLGPESSQDIKSVTLRAQSPSGPLELVIPISGRVNGESIHQLAARKAIQDLEEGRGWLHAAKTNDHAGTRIKKKYESRFDEIVEREVTRLGEKFQVASKWTSFVAVEEKGGEMSEEKTVETPVFAQPTARGFGSSASATTASAFGAAPGGAFAPRYNPSAPGTLFSMSRGGSLTGGMPRYAPQARQSAFSPAPYHPGGDQMGPSPGGLFGSASAVPPPSEGVAAGTAPRARQSAFSLAPYQPGGDQMGPSPGGLFGSAASAAPVPPPPAARMSVAAALAPPPVPVDQATLDQYQREMQDAACMPLADEDDEENEGVEEDDAEEEDCDMGFGLWDEPPNPKQNQLMKGFAAQRPAPKPTGSTMHLLISLQTFPGAWKWSDELLALVGVDGSEVDQAKFSGNSDVAATALVIAFFEHTLKEKKDVWEFVVAKAKAWLTAHLGIGEREVEDFVIAATPYVAADVATQ